MLTWFEEKPSSCPIIAEVAQSHDGSLGAAYAYIDAIARTGAAAVKFQTHIAAAESSPDEPWRVRFSPQDKTRFDYWRRIEFTAEQWAGLASYAREKGLIFLSSAFSPEAVHLLDGIGVPAWKVGAGEIMNLPLIEQMARTGKPVMLSSGMSRWKDLDAAIACVRNAGALVTVMQCTTAYPCPADKLGLNVLNELRSRYCCPVGLSDHSGTIYAGLAAAALGADMLEVHVTFSRECFGPDVPASVTMGELQQLVDGVSFIRRALANPVDKEDMAVELSEMRRIFGKSLVAARELTVGVQLTESDFAAKKPGTGIPVSRLKEFVNRRLKRAVAGNQRFSEEDFE